MRAPVAADLAHAILKLVMRAGIAAGADVLPIAAQLEVVRMRYHRHVLGDGHDIALDDGGNFTHFRKGKAIAQQGVDIRIGGAARHGDAAVEHIARLEPQCAAGDKNSGLAACTGGVQFAVEDQRAAVDLYGRGGQVRKGACLVDGGIPGDLQGAVLHRQGRIARIGQSVAVHFQLDRLARIVEFDLFAEFLAAVFRMGFQHDPAAVLGGFQGVPHRLIEIARRIARRRLEAAVLTLAIYVMMLLYGVIFRGGVETVLTSLRVSLAVIRRDGEGFMFGRGGGDIAALAHREMGVGVVCGIGHIMIGIVEIACFRSPIKAACLAMPMMCSAAAVGDQFLIGRMFVLTVCKGERPAFQRVCAPNLGGYRRAVKGALVDMACAGQLDPVNKFIGVPAVNLQLAAVDTKTRWIRTIRPDRRAIVQRVLDNQPSGISAAIRLSVNRIAAAAYQSALHRQLCALAEDQTAAAADGQISADGHVVSLNHVELGVGKGCVHIAVFTDEAASAPTSTPYNIAIGINIIREDLSALRQRRRLAEPVG